MPSFVPTQTPNYLTGQVVAVQYGGALLPVLSGNAKESAVVVKRTNSMSKGYSEIRFGIVSLAGSLKLAFNGDSPPAIRAGTFATLIIDLAGYELAENQENITPGQSGGTGTPTAPTAELITCNAGISDVDRSWNADSGDFSYDVTFQSSGQYAIAVATGATPTT